MTVAQAQEEDADYDHKIGDWSPVTGDIQIQTTTICSRLHGQQVGFGIVPHGGENLSPGMKLDHWIVLCSEGVDKMPNQPMWACFIKIVCG